MLLAADHQTMTHCHGTRSATATAGCSSEFSLRENWSDNQYNHLHVKICLEWPKHPRGAGVHTLQNVGQMASVVAQTRPSHQTPAVSFPATWQHSEHSSWRNNLFVVCAGAQESWHCSLKSNLAVAGMDGQPCRITRFLPILRMHYPQLHTAALTTSAVEDYAIAV